MARVRTGMRRVAKAAKMEERTLGRKAAARKGGKGQEKGGKGETRTCWTCGKTGHIAPWCRKGGNKNLYASENFEESAESDEDLQASCLLEESENEQWQEVIIRRSNQRAKKVNLEVKDKWVKVRATMDSGAAGHVMPETMFPHVKLERKTPSKKFVAANGEQIKNLGEKSIPFKTNEGVQRCIKLETCLCWTTRIRIFETHETEQ